MTTCKNRRGGGGVYHSLNMYISLVTPCGRTQVHPNSVVHSTQTQWSSPPKLSGDQRAHVSLHECMVSSGTTMPSSSSSAPLVPRWSATAAILHYNHFPPMCSSHFGQDSRGVFCASSLHPRPSKHTLILWNSGGRRAQPPRPPPVPGGGGGGGGGGAGNNHSFGSHQLV